ncbi:Alpha/Beta hydrolase protein [Cunninghamella echinulata]|nr:Alpha/Beta hydrolase protein [Cunninghamella echinulata]
MDLAKKHIRNIAPSGFVQQLVRLLLASPPFIAEYALNELTSPIGEQRKWIKMFHNKKWKGALIAPDIFYDTEEVALQRLKYADLVIFEIHGTMYMSAFTSWLELLKTNHGLNAVIISIEYGLAPRVTYPTPVKECINAYKYLTEDIGVCPSKVIVSGDSAGAMLSMEMLCHIYAPQLLHNYDGKRSNFDLELPAGMLLSSPLVSVNRTSKSWEKYEKSDIVTHALFERVLEKYIVLKANNIEDIAMLHLNKHLSKGGMEHICQGNILFFAGSKEVFHDDIIQFADMIRSNSTRLNVDVCKASYAHDWLLIRELIPSSDRHLYKQYDTMVAKWFCDTLKKAKENNVVDTVL